MSVKEVDMFEVTRKWINDNRTIKGAFTRKQIISLNVSWPPGKGWISVACGSLITIEQKEAFEASKDSYAGDKMKCPIEGAVNFIAKHSGRLTCVQKVKLLAAIN